MKTELRDALPFMLARSLAAVLCTLSIIGMTVVTAADRPNIVIIPADDLGYGDLSCFGAEDIATPNIDRMATEGTKFNSFYVSAVCSPTRAALMTGSHSARVGIGGVMFPRNNHGVNSDEITLPELLKGQGYATAIIGKWHLGNEDMFQPLNHGFDYWYGTPASNNQFYYPTIKKYAADSVFRDGYGTEEEEFYDTTEDAHEWTNHIDNPKYATIIKKLRALVPSFEDAAQPLPSALTRKRRENRNEKKKK